MNVTEDAFYESFHCVDAPNVNNSTLTIALSTEDPDVKFGNWMAVVMFQETTDCMCCLDSSREIYTWSPAMHVLCLNRLYILALIKA